MKKEILKLKLVENIEEIKYIKDPHNILKNKVE